MRPSTQASAAQPNGASANGVYADAAQTQRTQAAQPQAAKARVNPAVGGFPGSAMLPDVMSAGRESFEEAGPEDVETQVNRLRPRSIMMQLRFFKTLFFAFWLFGRLIFWQVYAARYFPGWVKRRNTQRWAKYAREFRYFAIDMGGVMIKAGQFASTRADALPEEVIAELVSLQDEVPTIPFERIRQVILRELGSISDRFNWIRPEPIAAASLGQVHRAELKNGDRVVVKVQRPGIRDVIYTDMAALFIVARVAMRFGFIRRRADVVALSEEFGRVLLEEVSYETETRNAERFMKMFAEDMGVYVPTIYREHSTDFLLTIEDVTSIKINDYEALAAAGIDRKDVAKRLMDTYMQQIFVDRFFHADPHPGNLFIYPLPVEDESQYIGKGGRPFYLIFIDFGMTGTLTREIVQALVDTLAAVILRDPKKLVASYQNLGFLLPGADTNRISEAIEAVFDQVWGLSMTDMNSIDFDVVANIGEEFNDLLYDMPFRVPQDFVYLGRTIGILSGMCTALDPEFNPWQEITYYMQQLITTDEESDLLGTIQTALLAPFVKLIDGGPQAFIVALQGAIRQVVYRIQTIERTEMLLQQIVSGEVAILSKPNPQYRRQLDRLEVQSRRTTRAFLFGSLLITSTMFYTSGDISLAMAAYSLTGLSFIWLLFTR